MRIRPRTTISAVIEGDDLHLAVVRFGFGLRATGATVLARQSVGSFLSMDPALRRAELAPIRESAGDASSLLLTIPSSWCALHPIAITSSGWASARDEVIRSIDNMLPLDPADASVGIIDLAGEQSAPSDAATTGMLVGAARSRIEPWSSALTEALGKPVTSVRTPQMAALGLGLQHDERAVVVEPDGSANTLRWGRPTTIGDLFDESTATDFPRLDLTSDPADESGGPLALAVASALAGEVAPGACRPIEGAADAAPRRWIAPAACAALTITLLVLASQTAQHRYAAGVERERQRQQALADELAETQRLRLETERLTNLLNNGVAATFNSWAPITPALAEAQAAIPGDGMLHRLELDRDAIALRGETLDAGAALSAIEASAAFTDAAFTAPVSKNSDGVDFFEIRADRTQRSGGTTP